MIRRIEHPIIREKTYNNSIYWSWPLFCKEKSGKIIILSIVIDKTNVPYCLPWHIFIQETSQVSILNFKLYERSNKKKVKQSTCNFPSRNSVLKGCQIGLLTLACHSEISSAAFTSQSLGNFFKHTPLNGFSSTSPILLIPKRSWSFQISCKPCMANTKTSLLFVLFFFVFFGGGRY